MLRLFAKTLKTGVVTERIKKPSDAELEQLGIAAKRGQSLIIHRHAVVKRQNESQNVRHHKKDYLRHEFPAHSHYKSLHQRHEWQD
jgi:hypothetical protein